MVPTDLLDAGLPTNLHLVKTPQYLRSTAERGGLSSVGRGGRRSRPRGSPPCVLGLSHTVPGRLAPGEQSVWNSNALS